MCKEIKKIIEFPVESIHKKSQLNEKHLDLKFYNK